VMMMLRCQGYDGLNVYMMLGLVIWLGAVLGVCYCTYELCPPCDFTLEVVIICEPAILCRNEAVFSRITAISFA
jgi:hypothetical protein